MEAATAKLWCYRRTFREYTLIDGPISMMLMYRSRCNPNTFHKTKHEWSLETPD